MATFFAALIILVCILLIIIVLVQNPKGGGLSSSFGGGIVLVVLVLSANVSLTPESSQETPNSRILESEEQAPQAPAQQPLNMPQGGGQQGQPARVSRLSVARKVTFPCLNRWKTRSNSAVRLPRTLTKLNFSSWKWTV
jgi:preprotein translocase subunit SecG